MYEYNAIVDRVVDGDTIKCTVDEVTPTNSVIKEKDIKLLK